MKQTQSDLILREKLASVGRLAAGIAHEINNPTAFLSSNLKTAGDYLQEIGLMVADYRQIMTELKTSAGNIFVGNRAQSLLDAVKKTEDRTDFDFIMADLADIFAECREGTESKNTTARSWWKARWARELVSDSGCLFFRTVVQVCP